MYDAVLLLRVPQMTQAAGELGRALARVGGHMEWATVPTGANAILTDRDYVTIASFGALPDEVSYLVLLIYAPDEREDEVCDDWDTFVDSFGISQQPTQALEDLVDQWQLAQSGQDFRSNPCGEISVTGLPQDHATNFLRQSNAISVTVFSLDGQGSSIEQGSPAEQEEIPANDCRRIESVIAAMRDNREQFAADLLETAGITPEELFSGGVATGRDSSGPIGIGLARPRRVESQHGIRMSAASAAAWRRSITNILPRQREACQRRLAAAEEEARFHIDWYATTTWSAPAPAQSDDKVWAYQIDQMEDQYLWNTIIWLVRGCQQLYVQYVQHRGDMALALAAKTWLKAQPIFRALLHEAIKRELTFPKDVYRYLKEYVLSRDDVSVQPSSPWKDPGASYQAGQLEEFLDESIVPEESIEETIGKNLRDIKID